MESCLLHGYGACRGKLSREHFISESVLVQFSAGRTATIGGLPWQPPATLQDIGISALQSKILCEGHNNSLSALDATASKFLRTLAQLESLPLSSDNLVQLDGLLLERWLLKVVIGMVAGQGAANGIAPNDWKQYLVGVGVPNGWGMYAHNPGGPQVFTKAFQVELRTHPETRAVLAAHFFYAGASLFLMLAKPDHPEAFGVHRPRGLIFKQDAVERRIEFLWPFHTNEAMIYSRIGTTADQPAFVRAWQSKA